MTPPIPAASSPPLPALPSATMGTEGGQPPGESLGGRASGPSRGVGMGLRDCSCPSEQTPSLLHPLLPPRKEKVSGPFLLRYQELPVFKPCAGVSPGLRPALVSCAPSQLWHWSNGGFCVLMGSKGGPPVGVSASPLPPTLSHGPKAPAEGTHRETDRLPHLCPHTECHHQS